MPARPEALPDDAALRAATLSFARKLPPPPPKPPGNSSLDPNPNCGPGLAPVRSGNSSPTRGRPRAAVRWEGSDDTRPPSRPSHPRSNSALAANLAFARSPATNPALRTDDMAEEIPSAGTVQARRKLFLESLGPQSLPRRASPPPLHQVSPERSRPGSPQRGGADVDATPIEDMSSIRNKFEQVDLTSKKKQPPPILAPKPIHTKNNPTNPSVVAAVLATQLSPPSSSPASRRSSPVHNDPPPPTQRSPIRKPVPQESSQAQVVLKPPQSAPTRGKPAPPLPSKPSKELLLSQVSATGAGTQSLGPTAAAPTHTLSSPSQARSVPPQPLQPRRKPAETPPSSNVPPQPPPPRRRKPVERSSSDTPLQPPGPVVEHVTIASLKPPPLPSRANSTSSPVPSDTTQYQHQTSAPTIQTVISSRPPPLPSRANTTLPSAPFNARTAAILSHSSSTTSLPLPRTPTGDSAVAAALAPSRAQTPGPRKPPQQSIPPPLPPRSASPQKSLPLTLRTSRRRTPSPPRPHYPLLHKTPHHAAAADTRYQNALTPKQRKRYEGLWAANKGTLMPPEQQDGVINIVVREIWSRSRLGQNLLAEVWGVVDRGSKGWLKREEFIVGTWLVDNALMGRKVPVKVAREVWEVAGKRG